MKSSEQMLMPEFFRNFQKKAKKSIKKPKKGDDDILLAMAESDAWELLKTIVEGINDSIDKQTKKAVGQAKSWEEIAKLYFARDISRDSVQAIIDIVELRKDAKLAEE